MKSTILFLLLLIPTLTNALTIREEIDALNREADDIMEIVTIFGPSSDLVTDLSRVRDNIRKRELLLNNTAETSIFVVANKGDYYLRVFKNGEEILKEKIVVGSDYRPTPEFSGEIKYVVLNPYWNVPKKLARKDIIPKMKRIRAAYGDDVMYNAINEGGYRFFVNGNEIPPTEIDWDSLSRNKPVPFTIRQDPGANNSLGFVKFVFPNKYSVYIHDTQHRELFDKKRRRYSSGCVRLQNPQKLASVLLGLTDAQVMEMVNDENNTNKWISLKNPVPVYIVNWDISVTEYGIEYK